MRSYPYRMGIAAIVTIAALRITIGWHFFKEGAHKLHDPHFSSQPFLEQAKGPLAPVFSSFIPDYDGRERLDKATIVDRWDQYAARLRGGEGVTDQQKKLVDARLKSFHGQLNWWFAENQEEIDTYFRELDRLEAAEQDRGSRGVPADVGFQGDWIAAKRAELRGTRDGFLRQLAQLDDHLESELSLLLRPEPVADPEQAAAKRHLVKVTPMPDPSSSWVDYVVKYFIFTVGVLLVLGLFTRVAALGAAAFMASVLATQPFWVSGVEPTYYQAVEFVVLLTLAALGAGRFLGLDYLIDAMRGRCCGEAVPPKTPAKENA